MNTSTGFGPIRPEHASGGWQLGGDESEWWLWKNTDEVRATVRATAHTTCSWRIGDPDGTLLREAPAADVEAAKSAADAWLRQPDTTFREFRR
jgi:hypothetical protein